MSKPHKNPQGRPWSGRTRGVAAAVLSALLLAACTDSPEAMVASAKSYLEKKDLDAASIQLKNALQENANLVDARFLLGRVNLEQGNVPGAVKEFQRALDLGYAKGEVLPLLVRSLVRSGEFDRVTKDFADAALDDPKAQAAVLTAVGDAYFAKGDLPKARSSYEKSLASADDVLARVGLARARLYGGDPAGAEGDLRAIVAQYAELAEAQSVLAEAALAQRRPDDAIKALEEVVRLNPSNVGSHYALVSLLLQQDRQEEAVARLEAMKKVAPKEPTTLYLQAFIDFRNNRFAEARDGALAALKSAPEFLPAHLLAGTAMVRLNENAQAQTHLTKVLSRVPGQPLARTMLATSHLALGEAPRALEVLQPLLDQPSLDARVLSLAGQVYLANDDFGKAESYFERASKAAPEDPRARMQLGVAKMAGGDAQGAFSELETAAQMDEGDIRADLALVAGHMRRGEIDKALKAQEQLERKQPDDPLVHNLRGGLMMAKRDSAAARAAFEKALALKPDYLSAAVNLARMDIADNKADDGVARLKAIADRDQKNVEAQLAYADVQVATRAEPAAVLATLERAEKASPSALVPKLALAQHYLRNRDAKTALSIAQQAVAAYPNDLRALETAARAQLAAGETQQAISSLNKALTLQPRATGALVQLADIHRANKDLTAAEQSLRKALVIRGDAVEAQARLAGILVERGDRDGALQIARTVQKQRADEAAGHALEGDIQATGGRWGDAVSSYRRAFDKGRDAQNFAKLHAALLRAERKGEADRLAADWLRDQPKDTAVRSYLAERALGDKRYADAVQLYRTLNELAPDNALVLNNLAWTASQIKDPKALEYGEHALKLAPDNAAVLDTVGVIQIDEGQAEKGLANLTRAVSLAPDTLSLRLNLAKAYAKLGRAADARKELDAVMPKLKEGTQIHSEATALLKTL
ncbi:XrtA/PEP-CTERM system TPR-repeat protein PrsT [Thauera sinica]|uniref:XrtA/PEP-CTERM system TPR-repeat protein PrsT n=1 Tax=Thauera sinica TaxID=2665146 RepID=A0ABW1ALA3_9RHOO|nr:XrtA/PEP-CTERM system TPR-repeat protein PrsT [Thauera sp. K11]ATE59090.1 PEP-CTERM system TPR-repeat protein PrsT [Thauera sp. K11]